jgi:hypothetical protein
MPEYTRNIVSAALIRNGWLSPDGQLHEIEDDFTHTDYAYQALGLVCPEDQGWLHISHNAMRYVTGGFPVRITQAQMDTLWDMYMEGRSRALVVWQKNALEDLRRLLDIKVPA